MLLPLAILHFAQRLYRASLLFRFCQSFSGKFLHADNFDSLVFLSCHQTTKMLQNVLRTGIKRNAFRSYSTVP